MTENIKKLLELASANEELKARLTNAAKEDILAIAKENGIALTDADFEQNAEISDDELDAVAGGTTCACVVGGSGSKTKENNERTCFCVMGGGGTYKGGGTRCWCAGLGTGDSEGVIGF